MRVDFDYYDGIYTLKFKATKTCLKIKIWFRLNLPLNSWNKNYNILVCGVCECEFTEIIIPDSAAELHSCRHKDICHLLCLIVHWPLSMRGNNLFKAHYGLRGLVRFIGPLRGEMTIWTFWIFKTACLHFNKGY